MTNDDDNKPFLIRGYRRSDREAVRKLCCDTGFLGEPIDPVYEDRELFADFLTTYYTDHEAESCFLLEVDGQISGYLLGSRKPLRNQLDPLFPVQPAIASFHSLDTDVRLARSSRPTSACPAFSHQPAAGGAQSFNYARFDECVSELPLSFRRETRVRPDRHVREPSR